LTFSGIHASLDLRLSSQQIIPHSVLQQIFQFESSVLKLVEGQTQSPWDAIPGIRDIHFDRTENQP
jgi:hypothetical protein